MMIQRNMLVGLVMLAALVTDEASKWAILHLVMQPPRVIEILPVFNLTLGFNTGVSFGLFSDTLESWPGTLALAKLAIALGLMIWAIRSEALLERIGLSLIAGGALGNIIDRWRQGGVTDFLDVHWADWHFPTFNVADVAITFGVICILCEALISLRPTERSESAPLG
jgi:signal peptidase II